MLNFLFLILSIAFSISSLFLNENFSIFSPSSWEILAVMLLLFLSWKLILNVQNSSGLNNSISCSLSVINFSATDWTLPADFEPGSLVQSIGDILNPTK